MYTLYVQALSDITHRMSTVAALADSRKLRTVEPNPMLPRREGAVAMTKCAIYARASIPAEHISAQLIPLRELANEEWVRGGGRVPRPGTLRHQGTEPGA